MLVCPQCEFENPDHNKFCQSCGTSLTHKTCQQCGAEIVWNREICPQCGADVAQVWWGIFYRVEFEEQSQLSCFQFDQKIPNDQEPVNQELTEEFSNVIELEQPRQRPITILRFPDHEFPEEEDLASTVTPKAETEELVNCAPLEVNSSLENLYLDPHRRYRISSEAYGDLEPWLTGELNQKFWTLEVVDTVPLQVTILKQLLDNENLPTLTQETPSSLTATLENLTIPEITFCYQALHKSFTHVVPKVHDAWQKDNRVVILLENRSQWQLLAEVWEQYQIQPLPVLHWMDQMAQLWSPLAQLGCAQSLLEINNLRLDEDETFCLQQLYTDAEDCLPTLKDLGHVWSLLFKTSEQTILGSLSYLLDELTKGKIKSVEALRSCIHAIAQSQNYSSSAAQNNVTTPGENNQIANAEFLCLPTLNSPPTQDESAQIDEDKLTESDELDISEMQTVVLPMQLSRLDYAALTDRGVQRDYNEDYFGVETQITKQEDNNQQTLQAKGLFIVCDGMGGHAGGEDASAMAVLTLQRYFQTHWHHELPNQDILRTGILESNQAIYAINQQNARSGNQRMGTTLVMALVQNNQVALAHVGDSRVYGYTRKRGLALLSVDHEVGQREIKLGVPPQEAYARPDAYQLTQALGPRSNDFVEPDLTYLEIKEDTLLILCSDGLSDRGFLENYAQDYIAPLLSSRCNLEQGVTNLIKYANQYNGHDNITAVVIRLRVRPKKSSSFS